MTALTLGGLVDQAREEGWAVTQTTNVHLDRADWPAGTGTVLVETFNEDGLPSYFAAGTGREEMVCIGGDKLNDRPFATTVEGVLEWARYTWDSPDDPLPAAFLEDERADVRKDDFDRLFDMTAAQILDDMKNFVRDTMVERGWARMGDDDQLELTEDGLRALAEGSAVTYVRVEDLKPDDLVSFDDDGDEVVDSVEETPDGVHVLWAGWTRTVRYARGRQLRVINRVNAR